MTRHGQRITSAVQFRAFAVEIISAAPDPDPRAIATKITEQLTDAECRIVVEMALPGWVRDMQAAATTRAISRHPGPSAKVAAIRAWRTRIEATALFNGTTHLALGDATIDDLLGAATFKRGKAQEILARADELDRLVQLMKRHRARTVHDLSDAALRGWLDNPTK